MRAALARYAARKLWASIDLNRLGEGPASKTVFWSRVLRLILSTGKA